VRDAAARQARAAFYREARLFASHVGLSDRSGAAFIVPTWDDEIGRKLFVHQVRGEMKNLKVVIRALRQLGLDRKGGRGVFVDVGANIGTTTITALLSYGFERALACEPEPRNVRMLRANVALNGLDERVLVVPLAVSSSAGHVELALHLTNSGAHQVVSAGGPLTDGGHAPRGEVIEVETITLDDVVQRGDLGAEDVGLLWLDVQGHEGHVLRGARSLTEHHIPLVLEFYPEALERAGGFELLIEEAARSYPSFADVRDLRQGAAERALRPTAELRALAGELRRESRSRFADLLLVADGR
jgi:FkbM family methyltransferase